MPGSKSKTQSSLFRSASKLSKQWKSASPKNSAEDIALKNYVSSKPLSEIAAETLKFNSHDRGMGNKGGDDNARNRILINNVKLQVANQLSYMRNQLLVVYEVVENYEVLGSNSNRDQKH
ncbi:hypothetical protein FXO38_06098 [Capsicum annuum]|nr:hypothetical protein FXO38_06098 [Capsicum annuum]